MPTTVPTDEEIRLRAYRLWEINGRQDGRDLDYWLQAAMELEEGVIAGGAMQPAPAALAANGDRFWPGTMRRTG